MDDKFIDELIHEIMNTTDEGRVARDHLGQEVRVNSWVTIPDLPENAAGFWGDVTGWSGRITRIAPDGLVNAVLFSPDGSRRTPVVGVNPNRMALLQVEGQDGP